MNETTQQITFHKVTECEQKPQLPLFSLPMTIQAFKFSQEIL